MELAQTCLPEFFPCLERFHSHSSIEMAANGFLCAEMSYELTAIVVQLR
jgi:hypothetical protein